MPYDRPRRRAERLAASVKAMKGAWAGEARLPGEGGRRAAIEGVQRPHPPLLIGGHGDRILTLAAQEADIVGLTGLTWTGSHLAVTGVSIEALAERVGFIEGQAGARFGQLELNILTQVTRVGADTGAEVQRAADLLGVEPDLVRSTPLTLIGSADEVADKLVATREQLGISYVVVFDDAIDGMAPVVARLAGT